MGAEDERIGAIDVLRVDLDFDWLIVPDRSNLQLCGVET